MAQKLEYLIHKENHKIYRIHRANKKIYAVENNLPTAKLISSPEEFAQHAVDHGTMYTTNVKLMADFEEINNDGI